MQVDGVNVPVAKRLIYLSDSEVPTECAVFRRSHLIMLSVVTS